MLSSVGPGHGSPFWIGQIHRRTTHSGGSQSARTKNHHGYGNPATLDHPDADHGGGARRGRAGRPGGACAQAQAATCNGLPVTISGTAGNDTITGTAGNDVIATAGGNDTVFGLDGNDTVCLGSGNDVFNGGAGNDTTVAPTASLVE